MLSLSLRHTIYKINVAYIQDKIIFLITVKQAAFCNYPAYAVCERGNDIGVGTLAIDTPFQTFAVGLLVKFID